MFGHHPETGKFFVASKSAFNKNPKLNHSDADIDSNHGHAPGLVTKLKHALHHLPKVAPKTGVFQGDMMYSKEDVKTEGGKHHFTPNTLTYSAKADSEHGKKIAKAKIGLVVHTQYHGTTMDNMKAGFHVDHASFTHHDDVHNVNPHTTMGKMDPKASAAVHTHLSAAKALSAKIDHSHTAQHGHEASMKQYVNDTVRAGTAPSAEGYHKFVQGVAHKQVESMKSDAGRQKKSAQYKAVLDHISGNKQHFDDVFKVHHHIAAAKHELVNALSKHSEFEHHINGEKAKPEGFVATHNGMPSKLVDRAEFSRANLTGHGKFQKATKE